MTINPVDIARDIISIGTTAGVKKDVIDLQAAKLRILTDELGEARTRISALEIENRQLRRQLEDSQPVAQPGEPCPYCRRTTGQLVELTKHPVFFMQGWKVGHYKCSNPQCGKTYEHDLER